MDGLEGHRFSLKAMIGCGPLARKPPHGGGGVPRKGVMTVLRARVAGDKLRAARYWPCRRGQFSLRDHSTWCYSLAWRKAPVN